MLDIARAKSPTVLFILEQALSIREKIWLVTARLFGFRRTGTRVVRRIEAGIRLLVNGGQVQEKGSMCVLASHLFAAYLHPFSMEGRIHLPHEPRLGSRCNEHQGFPHPSHCRMQQPPKHSDGLIDEHRKTLRLPAIRNE